ncbi:MAG TPA: hypothetical protein VD963_09790, partial [Phycisphaerales bacterium]|nr:hypothetical protein [Phycisphaerales bacterium]
MPRLAAIVLLAGLAAPLAPALAQPGTRGAPAAREAAAPAGDPGPDLPIRRITLYRSGVGFFQRQGEVEGDRQAHLSFHAEQVNDILKSLVILDLGGGRIDSVSYASKDPVSRRLGSFQVPIADNPPLGVLLERLRGSTVELLAVTGPVVATIVGTETRKVPSGKDQPLVDTVYVNFVPEASPGTIETMPITELRGVRLRDRLKDDLDKALGALDEQRAETVKTVDITFSGAGEREVVVAYVHEMPVWKTSYRLILPEAPAAARERAPDAGADREAPPRGDSQ